MRPQILLTGQMTSGITGTCAPQITIAVPSWKRARREVAEMARGCAQDKEEEAAMQSPVGPGDESLDRDQAHRSGDGSRGRRTLMPKRAYVIAFMYEETGKPEISEVFDMPAERDAELAHSLIVRLSDAGKVVTKEVPGSFTAVMMNFIDDMDPAERGPFLMTAAVAYYSKMFMERMTTEVMKKALRGFLDNLEGGSHEPG